LRKHDQFYASLCNGTTTKYLGGLIWRLNLGVQEVIKTPIDPDKPHLQALSTGIRGEQGLDGHLQGGLICVFVFVLLMVYRFQFKNFANDNNINFDSVWLW